MAISSRNVSNISIADGVLKIKNTDFPRYEKVYRAEGKNVRKLALEPQFKLCVDNNAHIGSKSLIVSFSKMMATTGAVVGVLHQQSTVRNH